MSEPVAKDWNLVADVSAQFDPASLEFLNGPESAYQQNYSTLAHQQASGDNSKSYGFVNDKALVGVSNPVLGTLTVGRQRTFSYDLGGAYDAGGNNFSLNGMTSTPVGGTGLSTLGRYNTSVKYSDTYGAFHGGAMYQFGGYEQGNVSNGAFEADFGATYAGFSFDAIYQHATDAASLSAVGKATGPAGEIPGVPGNTLNVTLANVDGGVLMTKYNWQQFTVYGVYGYDRLSTPSDLYGAAANGSASGWFVHGMNGGFPAIVQANAYVNAKILQTVWTGVKYSVLPNLDLNLNYGHEWQNNYTNAYTKYNVPTYLSGGKSTTTKAGVGCGPNVQPAIAGETPQGSNAGACAGTTDVVGFLIDYRPVKRVDLYAGVAYSEVSGGMASGYQYSNNTVYDAGIKIGF